jgi:hypothetical protein
VFKYCLHVRVYTIIMDIMFHVNIVGGPGGGDTETDQRTLVSASKYNLCCSSTLSYIVHVYYYL